MAKVKIFLLVIFVACIYGVVHDQITIRLCPEYFTVAHPPLFQTSSLTLLAFDWGVAATAGLGLIVGFLLALVAYEGRAPAFPLSRLWPMVLGLVGIMAILALAAGIAGYSLSRLGVVAIPEGLSFAIPQSRHDRFMAVWFAHGASYLVGLAGSVVLYLHVWLARGRPRVISIFPRTPGAVVRVILLALMTAYLLWARFGRY